jgi:hypothetical protein
VAVLGGMEVFRFVPVRLLTGNLAHRFEGEL